MLVNWAVNKDLKDSEDLIIKGAATVIFAGVIFILDEVFLWDLDFSSLAGISVFTGIVGYLIATVSSNLIKAIPFLFALFLTLWAAVDGFSRYMWHKERALYIEPFLVKTNNCKALDAQLVNLEYLAPVCMKIDTHKKRVSCDHKVDNEWICSLIAVDDILAKPDWPTSSEARKQEPQS